MPDGELTPTARYQSILSAAREIARSMDHDYLGAEHLFLAIIRDSDAVPTHALASAVNPASIEYGILDLMRSPGYTTPTRLKHGPVGPEQDGT